MAELLDSVENSVWHAFDFMALEGNGTVTKTKLKVGRHLRAFDTAVSIAVHFHKTFSTFVYKFTTFSSNKSLHAFAFLLLANHSFLRSDPISPKDNDINGSNS